MKILYNLKAKEKDLADKISVRSLIIDICLIILVPAIRQVYRIITIIKALSNRYQIGNVKPAKPLCYGIFSLQFIIPTPLFRGVWR